MTAPPSPAGVRQFTKQVAHAAHAARPVARREQSAPAALMRPPSLSAAANAAATGRISSDKWRMVDASAAPEARRSRGEAAAAAALAAGASANAAAPNDPYVAELKPKPPAAPAAPAVAAPKPADKPAESVGGKRQLQQLDGNAPQPAAPSKQPKPSAEPPPAAAQAPPASAASAGEPLTAKAVGKAVRGSLRGHPELQQATLKQLRKHLETALAQDLTEWKDEIKRATQAFMQAQAQAQAQA